MRLTKEPTSQFLKRERTLSPPSSIGEMEGSALHSGGGFFESWPGDLLSGKKYFMNLSSLFK
jgi:hypothetical protein